MGAVTALWSSHTLMGRKWNASHVGLQGSEQTRWNSQAPWHRAGRCVYLTQYWLKTLETQFLGKNPSAEELVQESLAELCRADHVPEELETAGVGQPAKQTGSSYLMEHTFLRGGRG